MTMKITKRIAGKKTIHRWNIMLEEKEVEIFNKCELWNGSDEMNAFSMKFIKSQNEDSIPHFTSIFVVFLFTRLF